MSFAAQAEKASRARQLKLLEESLRMTTEALETGEATLKELNRQGEQIKRIEGKVAETDHMAEQGSYILRGMKGFGGRIKNFFSGPPKRKVTAEEAAAAAARAESVRTAGARTRKAEAPAKSGGYGRRGPAVPPPAAPSAGRGRGGDSVLGSMFEEHALPTTMADERDEHDVFLDEISKGMGTLKEMGLAMGDEIDRQNVRLDKVTGDVDRVDRKLRKLRFTADTIA